LLVEINSFANPYPYEKCELKSFLTDFHSVWLALQDVYLRELPDLAYQKIASTQEIEASICEILAIIKKK